MHRTDLTKLSAPPSLAEPVRSPAEPSEPNRAAPERSVAAHQGRPRRSGSPNSQRHQRSHLSSARRRSHQRGRYFRLQTERDTTTSPSTNKSTSETRLTKPNPATVRSAQPRPTKPNPSAISLSTTTPPRGKQPFPPPHSCASAASENRTENTRQHKKPRQKQRCSSSSSQDTWTSEASTVSAPHTRWCITCPR